MIAQPCGARPSVDNFMRWSLAEKKVHLHVKRKLRSLDSRLSSVGKRQNCEFWKDHSQRLRYMGFGDSYEDRLGRRGRSDIYAAVLRSGNGSHWFAMHKTPLSLWQIRHVRNSNNEQRHTRNEVTESSTSGLY